MIDLKTACLYGLKPHELGYCGPKNAAKSVGLIKRYLRGEQVDEDKIREILLAFPAACRFYSSIASQNSVTDIFDRRVVKAYWLGNDFLDHKEGYKLHHNWYVYSSSDNYKLADLCRIGWGEVIRAKTFKVMVKYQPIIKNETGFYLGNLVEKELSRVKGLIADLQKGDIISFHWNMALEVLSEEDLRNLQRYTQKVIDHL